MLKDFIEKKSKKVKTKLKKLKIKKKVTDQSVDL